MSLTVVADAERMRAAHAAAVDELPYRHPESGSGRERIPVVDPATGAEWGSAPVATGEDVSAAVAAARDALPGWSRRTPSERAELMRRMADAIERRAGAISATVTLENGSPVNETGGAAAGAAAVLRVFAGFAERLEAEDVRPVAGTPFETQVRRYPYGVAALIAPWNYPINLVASKLAPALLAGCTVVAKPAPTTPLSALFLRDAAEEAGIPAGVVNVVAGGAATGDELVRHPGVDKVAFTGSTAVGRRIAGICGELLRPVTLELGGKSAAVVLPDADLDVLAGQLFNTSLRNTGQTCFLSTRIIATPDNYHEVVDAVAAAVEATPVGDPLEKGTLLGPLASEAQRERVLGYVRSGIDDGARVVLGGDVRPPVLAGSFVAPTVFADVDPHSKIAQEEIFGPVLSVIAADDVDDAVGIANATRYGLGGAVFGRDETAAGDVAARIDTGTIGVNGYLGNLHAPFGGRRDSGMGVEFGFEGLNAYLATQSLHRPAR